jgi:ribonuclease D
VLNHGLAGTLVAVNGAHHEQLHARACRPNAHGADCAPVHRMPKGDGRRVGGRAGLGRRRGWRELAGGQGGGRRECRGEDEHLPEYGARVTLALAEKAATHKRMAIDTEFVSERRYQALLCLAQVGVPDPDAPDGVSTEVIDPLGDDPPDPAPLAGVLADPEVEVVVHAGRQDIAILRRVWETEITNVFDTQLAAGFIGMGNQEGYESLVRKVLGVRLKGAEGFTQWDRRPLTAQQLEYAADDARLLLALGDELEERLRERGRLDWAREECLALETSTDERSPNRM